MTSTAFEDNELVTQRFLKNDLQPIRAVCD